MYSFKTNTLPHEYLHVVSIDAQQCIVTAMQMLVAYIQMYTRLVMKENPGISINWMHDFSISINTFLEVGIFLVFAWSWC